MNKVYIVAANRSAIGTFLGSLSNVSPLDFGSQVLKEMLKKNQIKPELIDEVILGQALPAGHKQGLARQISLAAGILPEVSAYGVNMVCGSGMKSVVNAYLSIKAGYSKVVVAGGIESMSKAPFLVDGNIRAGSKMGNLNLIDSMLTDGLTDAFQNYHMGLTAETISEQFNITREQQDDYAFSSQLKARSAEEKGLFEKEIIPIHISTKKGDVIFKTDEYINQTTTKEKIASLKPAFKQNGTVTAASSSGINDGVSFIVLADEKTVLKENLKPLAEIIGIGEGGTTPDLMGLAPIPAIRKSLKDAGLTLNEIDVIELNESFAAQALAVIGELAAEHQINKEELLKKTNPLGGAIALGHPIGASGNRILVTLIHHLEREKHLKLGLASLCIGGGMGISIILKKA